MYVYECANEHTGFMYVYECAHEHTGFMYVYECAHEHTGFIYVYECAHEHTGFMYVSSIVGTVRPGFLRWQRMAAQGRRIIKNSGRRIIIYAGN
jgi:hypothetical protein